MPTDLRCPSTKLLHYRASDFGVAAFRHLYPSAFLTKKASGSNFSLNCQCHGLCSTYPCPPKPGLLWPGLGPPRQKPPVSLPSSTALPPAFLAVSGPDSASLLSSVCVPSASRALPRVRDGLFGPTPDETAWWDCLSSRIWRKGLQRVVEVRGPSFLTIIELRCSLPEPPKRETRSALALTPH